MFCNVKYSAISTFIFACAVEDSWLKTFRSFWYVCSVQLSGSPNNPSSTCSEN